MLHLQVRDVSYAVELLIVFHFLVLVVNTQILVDFFLVVIGENGSTKNGIDGDDDAGERSHPSHSLLEESEDANSGEANANEVGLHHVQGHV